MLQSQMGNILRILASVSLGQILKSRIAESIIANYHQISFGEYLGILPYHQQYTRGPVSFQI